MDNLKHYYKIVYKIAVFSGAWPLLKPTARILRVGFFTLILITIFIPQMAYQISCKSNIRCTFESMTSYFTTFMLFVKMCTLQLNNHEMKDIVQHLIIDWKTIKSPEELKIMQRYAKTSSQLCLLYIVYVNIAVITFFSLPLVPFVLDVMWPLNESRPILQPYPGYYFVDINENFFKIFWHSLISFEIIFMSSITFDLLLMIYIKHICSMFTIIGLNYENLFSNCNKATIITNTFKKSCCKKIMLVVHAHREILRLIELLENAFCIPFAIHMFVVVTVLSITLVQITQLNDLLETIRYFLYAGGQLLHLFWFSYAGQMLIDHSLQMTNKIYNSSWYEVSASSQKLIILVMMRSRRPSYLSAGKIYIFSLESFTTAVQTSMSYFTVLATV